MRKLLPSFWIIIASTFLNVAGFTIIIPVLPASAARYVPADRVAATVSIILSVYALCSFVSAPLLGALSDRFGRRPIMILSLLGSAAGFLIFGIGGALWVLLLGRVIDGLTAGSISTLFATVADTKEPSERGAAYGLLGATAGLGFMCGPALGGLMGEISLAAPLYAAAALFLLNALLVLFALPESHPADKRPARLDRSHLNPLSALSLIFTDGRLRPLFLIAFAFFGAATLMQANLAVLLTDLMNFDAAGLGAVLFGVGVIDIASQGVAAPRLMKLFPEKRIAAAGLVINGLGFVALALLPFWPSIPLLAAGILILTFGDGLVQPALNAMISEASPPDQQGRVQGANQAQQAIARMAGPLLSAWLYAGSASAPYWVGALILILDAITLLAVLRRTVPSDNRG